jgi:hypothetical protein
MKKSIILTISHKELQDIIDKCSSFVEILQTLGFDGYNGNHRTLSKRLKLEIFDFSKFNINKKIRISKIIKNKVEPEKIFIIGKKINNKTLKHNLIKENIKPYICSCCGLGPVWNGLELNLQIDHINGNNIDNRIENLRFICPNCHTQTTTFSGRNSSLNKNKKCLDCRVKITNKSTHCYKCSKKYIKRKYKFDVTKEELEKLIKEHPMTTVGKMFGVTDNSIRKRCKKLGVLIEK